MTAALVGRIGAALLALVALVPGTLLAGPVVPRRLALVVGNVNYTNHTALPNVTNDVKAVSDELRKIGFDMVETPPERGSYEEFLNLDLAPFAGKIQHGDIVVFYYSGHGFSYGGENFIVPTQVPAQVSQADVQFVFPAETTIRSLLRTRKPGFLLMILDSCRTRPGFVKDGQAAGAEKASYEFRAAPPENTTIASATAPGYAASAGAEGGKSVFSEALAANIGEPGQELSTLQGKISYRMGQVGNQKPWFSESRVARLWLRLSPEVEDEARRNWEQAKATGLRSKVEEYLAWYAVGPYAADAQKWLDDNPTPALGRTGDVTPLSVDLAWNDARQANAVAAVAAFDGLRLTRSQSLRMATMASGDLSEALRINPLAMSDRVLVTRPLGNGAIKRGSVIDLPEFAATPDLAALLTASRTLGRPKLETFVVADPAGSGATVAGGDVVNIVRQAREGGEQIAWVSLATARGDRTQNVARGLMATDVAANLAKAGIPADRITTVEQLPEAFDGVRVRIFTK